MTKKKAVTKKKVEKNDENLAVNLDEIHEQELEGVTFQQIQVMIKEFSEAKAEYDEAKRKSTSAKEIMDNHGKRLLEVLKKHEVKSMPSPYGHVITSVRWSWKTPKEKSAREAFFGYLKEKELYEEMITVNSQSLNAFCKGELEAAKEEGNFDFTIPGLDEPSLTETISLRRS